MINPTMALIPSGYGQDKIYSMLPVNGDGDLDFNRTGKAYRVNENGLVDEVQDSYPRLDWTGGDCPAILIERSGSNEIHKSEDLSSSAWSETTGITVTPNATISPDGTLNADKVEASGTSVYTRIHQQPSLSGTTAVSIYLKQNVGDKVHFYMTGNFNVTDVNGNSAGTEVIHYMTFDYGTKRIETNEDLYSSILDSNVEELDNGWFRVAILLPSTTLNRFQVMPRDAFSNATESSFMWGAMAEEANDLSSYIKNATSNGIVTRGVESIDDKALAINSSQGVLYVEMAAMSNNGTIRQVSLNNGGSGDQISIGFGATDNTIVAKVMNGGVDAFTGEIVIPSVKAFNKIALSYREDSFQLWIGGLLVADTQLIEPIAGGTLTQLSFDAGGLLPVPFYGKIKDLRIYNEALSVDDLRTLTI